MIIRKEKIISAIEKIFIKKGGLLANVDPKCEDKPYLVDNFYDDKAIKETTRPFKYHDVPSDDLAYEDTIDLISAVNITKENVTTSNFNIDAGRNSNNTSDNTLSSFFKEPSNINGYIVHDVHKNSDAYRYDATSSLEHEQLDEIEYASNEKLIIFVSIASVFGLIAFLSNKPPIYEDCGAFFYSCNSPIDAIDTSKMSTKVLDLFNFNQKVISLTKKLWKRLLHLLDHSEVYDEEHVCFSIIDTDRCSTLNKYFLSLSYSRADFKRPNINSNLHNDYLDLLKRQYVSLESFLTQTLPHLALNIENLTLKIQRSYNQVLNVTSFNSANIGGEVNKAIHNYFKRLRWTIMKFKPENIPSEVKEKKERIDNLIDGYYRDKSIFLAIPIVGIESELNEDYHFNTSLDQNAPAALTISTTPTISKDLHVSTMSSTTSDAPTSIGIPK
ncbi:hypothetical protein NBO_7g0040, partial [Nosema bombycis CQ1]